MWVGRVEKKSQSGDRTWSHFERNCNQLFSCRGNSTSSWLPLWRHRLLFVFYTKHQMKQSNNFLLWQTLKTKKATTIFSISLCECCRIQELSGLVSPASASCQRFLDYKSLLLMPLLPHMLLLKYYGSQFWKHQQGWIRQEYLNALFSWHSWSFEFPQIYYKQK